MAYDKAKAHEYYIKYRKKGLKKGRKKSTKKSTTSKTSSLLGTSTSGLNDEGRIEAAAIKDRYKKQMNEALAKATTDAEKEKIRVEYSKRAQREIAALKSNPKFTTAKKSSSSGSKASAKKSSGSSSGGKKTSGASGGGSKKTTTTATSGSGRSTSTPKVSAATLNTLRNNLDVLSRLLQTASAEQKKKIAAVMKPILSSLKTLRGLSSVDEKRYSILTRSAENADR